MELGRDAGWLSCIVTCSPVLSICQILLAHNLKLFGAEINQL